MASFLHEVLVAMFADRPALAAELLSGPLGLAVPAHDAARVASGEVVQLRPVAHRADNVVLLGEPAVLAVVVEVQLHLREEKRWVWPEYLTAVRLRERCPAVLLVLCLEEAVERWAARPIELGDGVSVVVPQVLGPAAIPVLTDPVAAAAVPELAVLSALAHVHEDGPFEVLDAAAVALDSVPVEQALNYYRLMGAVLPDLARRHLEELMATETFEYQSEFTRALEAKGEARGRAAMVLRILAARGLEIDEDTRTRITECTDLAQLDAWGDAAVTAGTVADLFA